MSVDNSPQTLSERMYFHEMTTWNNLSGQLQLILAVLIVYMGFTWNLVGKLFVVTFSGNNFPLIILFVWASIGCGLIDLFKTLLSFWKAWHGYEYPVMIAANELYEHKKEIFKQYEGYSNQQELTDEGFNKVLEEKFRVYASIAAKNNGYKMDHLYNCKLKLMPSIGLIVLSYIMLSIIM